MQAFQSLQEAVFAAEIQFHDYIYTKLDTLAARLRYGNGHLLTVGFAGHGGSGKDSIGDLMNRYSMLHYRGAISDMLAPMIAWCLNVSQNIAFSQRREHREYWACFADILRRNDPALLMKLLLGSDADVVVGVRRSTELEAIKKAKLLTHIVWVQGPSTIKPDPTLEVTEADCTYTLDNSGNVDELPEQVRKMIVDLKLPKSSKFSI